MGTNGGVTTVMGLSASRMLAIEASCVVDGEVDTNGHLILTKFDETQIDAGNVIGPAGPPGPSGGPEGPQGPPGPPGPSGVGGQYISQVIGDGASRSFVIPHSMHTRNVNVNVYRAASPYDEIITEVEHTDIENVTIRTVMTPGPGEYMVIISSAGTPSAAIWAGYTHNQPTAAASWVVVHNLNRHPSVMVVDTGDSVIVPDIHYDSLNQITINFGSATSGKAYLN